MFLTTGSVRNMGKRPSLVETRECPNRKLGCNARIRQTELESHVERCLYRWVACEACGKRLLDVDIYKHQSRSRCMENKLKREVCDLCCLYGRAIISNLSFSYLENISTSLWPVVVIMFPYYLDFRHVRCNSIFAMSSLVLSSRLRLGRLFQLFPDTTVCNRYVRFTYGLLTDVLIYRRVIQLLMVSPPHLSGRFHQNVVVAPDQFS